ncbi:MAG: CBS domain-containing protein [bacterium]
MVENVSIIHELAYNLRIKEIIKKEVIAVKPNNSIGDLRNILREKRISGAPVVDEGKLLGIISIEDVINCLASGEITVSVSEKMTKDVEVLYDDDSLVHAIEKFDMSNYGRFPVVSRQDGRLVGIITKGDIVHGLLERLESEYHTEEIKQFRASHIFDDIVANKIDIVLHYYVVGNNFKQAGEASSGLKKTLTRLGIHPSIVRRIVVASYEAEMNMVIFADKGQFVANIQPHQIRINAIDCGPGIPDIKQAMEIGFSTAPEWVREMGFGAGLGLNNIQKCADTLEINSRVGKGTRVKMVFNM